MIGLTYIRKLYNLSMKELSEQLGISANTINLWEKLKMPISEKRADQLKEFFHLPEIVFQKEITEDDKIKIQQIKLENDKLNNNIGLHEQIIVEVEKEVIPENAIIIDEKYKGIYNKIELLLSNNVDTKALEQILNGLIKINNIKEC